MTVVTDDCNRANAATLGTGYAKALNFSGASTDVLGIVSGQATPVNSGYGEVVRSDTSLGQDQYSKAKVAGLPVAGGDYGATVRHSGSGATSKAYRVALAVTGNAYTIQKVTGGSSSSPLKTGSQVFAVGDEYKLEATGGSPTTVKLYRRASGSGTFTVVDQVVDSSSPLTGGGFAGTYMFTNGGTSAALDDLEYGDVVTGGVAPSNTAAPAITDDSTPQTGETVTVSNGTWSGDAPITFAYQWKRNGVAISGATSNSYVLQAADEGQNILCTVTATNATGSASADSNAIVPSAATGAPQPTCFVKWAGARVASVPRVKAGGALYPPL